MSKQNFYPIILAGGSGTRFWPKSRQATPKQFLDVTGEGSLMQMTARRLLKRSPARRIFIVTSAVYRTQVAAQLRAFKIPSENILCEPSGKNTAPAVCWAAAVIHRIDSDAVVGVFPSDHVICAERKFLSAVEKAIAVAQEDSLVTFGIRPTRPETGYGYLRTVPFRSKLKDVARVAEFVEKPDIRRARQFIRRKNYFWNSGMFVWRARVILEEFKRHLPQVLRLISLGTSPASVARIWPELPSVSVDYGILERSDRVVAVTVDDIGWSDLGSWEALWEILPKDKQGNVRRGDVTDIDTRDSLIWSEKKAVAVVGLDGVVIVDTPDALLVCRKDCSQKVRDVIGVLKKRSHQRLC